MPAVAPSPQPRANFHPDEYRMTVGEHLEELRTRMIWALGGFAIVLVVCLVFSRHYVVPAFCAPLIETLRDHDINPQLVTGDVSEGFMVYIRISLISAAALSGPWVLYQLWLFVAAGLYPQERRYVTRYLPLSIALLISGMLLVYFVILPLTLDFFIGFSIGIPLPAEMETTATTQPATTFVVPQIPGNPPGPAEGQLWFDTTQQRLKFFLAGKVRVVPFGGDELVRPEISLDHYMSLVVAMLLSFGLSFQLPLVVLALVRLGILDLEMLKESRRYVYFIMVIVAAVITPGQDIPSLIGLTVPLCLLFELGLWLAREPKGAGAGTV
jgi:sec-independent protein translocase protein TatC